MRRTLSVRTIVLYMSCGLHHRLAMDTVGAHLRSTHVVTACGQRTQDASHPSWFHHYSYRLMH
jgi:hypothetical protein